MFFVNFSNCVFGQGHCGQHYRIIPQSSLPNSPVSFLFSAYLVPSDPGLDIDQTLEPAQLISDAVKRSSKAHLFHFYPTLNEIVAIPRKTPTAWVMTNAKKPTSRDSSTAAKPEEVRKSVAWNDVITGSINEGRAVELDARALVKECLKEIGREMGVGR